jgi:putative hemolysin
VTLEDLIESIIGEIEDEYDILPNYVYQITDDRFLVGGSALCAALQEKIDSQFPQFAGTFDEWMRGHADKSPAADDRVQEGTFECIVKKVRRSRVYEAFIQIKHT